MKLALFSLTFAMACGTASDRSDDDFTPGKADGGMQMSTRCLERCANRALACGAPSQAAAAEVCTNACSGNPNDSQIACLETTDCNALQGVIQSRGSICGIDFGATKDAGTGADASSGMDATTM